MTNLFDKTVSGTYWCVPSVIAMAAGVTYSEVEAALAEVRPLLHPRKHAGIAGCHEDETRTVLSGFGIASVPVVPPQLLRKFKTLNTAARFQCNLRRAITAGCFRGGTFRLSTGYHTLLVRDYMVFDNWHAKWVWFADYHMIGSKLRRAWRLEGAKS